MLLLVLRLLLRPPVLPRRREPSSTKTPAVRPAQLRHRWTPAFAGVQGRMAGQGASSPPPQSASVPPTSQIDLADVKPAADGRVRHGDLDAYLTYNAHKGYGTRAARQDEQVRVIGLRRRIAENMAASKRAIPHFTYVEEIDMTKAEDLRADLNATRGDKPKLTVLPIIIAAITRATARLPDDQRAL